MNEVKAPEGCKRIRVHFVCDCKHDGRLKARLVANGHLTDAPLESVYSGVVSLCGFCMVMFLAELNNLEFGQPTSVMLISSLTWLRRSTSLEVKNLGINMVTSLLSAKPSIAFDPVDNDGTTVSLTASWSWDLNPARLSKISG